MQTIEQAENHEKGQSRSDGKFQDKWQSVLAVRIVTEGNMNLAWLDFEPKNE